MAKSDRRPGEPHADVTYWLNEISASRKRERDYRKEGQRILDIYSGKKIESKITPFNILYSNTETLLPALYSAIPRPVVQRRFKDSDPLGKAAAQAGQRVLEFLVDTNAEGYETFDEGVRAATLDALLPGRGVTGVQYEAEVPDVPQGDGAEPLPVKASEVVCLNTRNWTRISMGYAKKWSKVPWIAYEEHLDEEECTRLFGQATAKKIIYTEGEQHSDRSEDLEPAKDRDERHTGERKTALIYQIWDKDGGRKLRYISPQFTEGALNVEDDPLSLTGFFNCPRPLQFLEQSNDLLPVALYTLYENQAKELNRLTVRINKIVDACKVRGIYDSALGQELKNLLSAAENELVPTDSASSLATEKGMDKAIWFFPIDVIVLVLEKLYLAREQCKRVIYEVTGISDIIRGSSVASETATAQTLKSQWGTLRLKRLQKEVQRYARDLLRMMLEIAATKFSEDTWAKMTGLPFTTTERAKQLKEIAQAAQMSGQPLDPKTQAELQSPIWGDVLAMLKTDTQRAYRIDIETNSTVEPEAVEDQKNISELMTALGQFLNGVGPLVAEGVMPFEAAQTMMLAITRRFRFGSEIEDQIRAMQPPKPKDDGKAAAAQAEMAKLEVEKKKLEVEAMKAQAEEARQQQVELAKHQRETTAEQNKMAQHSQQLQQEQTIELVKIDAEKSARLAELQAERQTAQMKAKIEQDTELRKLEFERWKVAQDNATKIAVAQIAAKASIEQADIKAEAAAEAKTEGELTDDGSTATRTKPTKKPAIEHISEMNSKMLEGMTALTKTLASPKKIERDANGRATRVVPG